MVRTPQTCAVHGRMVVAAYGRAKMLSPVCPRRVVFPLLPAPLSRCRGIADLLCTRSDYTNPIDLCNGLNKYIIPEVAIHAFLTFLFLINGYWLPLILNLPLVAWNAKKCVAPARTVRSFISGLRADWMQDHREQAPPGCDRDLPEAERPQEGTDTLPSPPWKEPELTRRCRNRSPSWAST